MVSRSAFFPPIQLMKLFIDFPQEALHGFLKATNSRFKSVCHVSQLVNSRVDLSGRYCIIISGLTTGDGHTFSSHSVYSASKFISADIQLLLYAKTRCCIFSSGTCAFQVCYYSLVCHFLSLPGCFPKRAQKRGAVVPFGKAAPQSDVISILN